MKILYSILKEYCSVSLEPRKLADLLTRHGVKVESIEGQGDNTVFEFEITANRPDCLSFIGIAREVALLSGAKTSGVMRRESCVRRLDAKRKTQNAECTTPFIQIKEPKLCPIYIGRIIRDVKVGPSPVWLKGHLESLGFRSINNIVDITNFVLLETGQPLHAFDLDKLAGQEIIVRTASKGEKMTAIDGKTYKLAKRETESEAIGKLAKRETESEAVGKLSQEMLVIADTRKPVALAGIMGGKETEVIESTRNILLESAYFNPVSIRRTSRQLALSSDSSYRFERIVDPKGVETASQRATGLILELAKGTLTGYQALDYLKYKERKVSLRTERINRILGITIPWPEIKRILIGLGIKILSAPNAQRPTPNALRSTLHLLVPSFRPDINLEIDVIEELARVWGYDRIPVTPSCIELKLSQEDKIYDVTKTARSHLVESGYNEVMTNSFWDKGVVTESEYTTLIRLSAPDGTTDRFLRNNLVRGLLDVFNLNENYLHSEAQKTIKLFEISKVYFGLSSLCHCEERSDEAISTAKNKSEIATLPAVARNDKNGFQIQPFEGFHLAVIDNAGFYSLKGALEGLFSVLGLKDKVSFAAQTSVVAPSGVKNIVGINLDNNPIGYLGTMQKDETTIGVGEIDFEALISRATLAKPYKSFIRLPAVTRDIAVVVPESTIWEQIENTSRQALTSSAKDVPLEKIEFFDIYRGKQVSVGHKSMAFSLVFRHPTRTLASEAVDEVVQTVVSALAQDLKATLRT